MDSNPKHGAWIPQLISPGYFQMIWLPFNGSAPPLWEQWLRRCPRQEEATPNMHAYQPFRTTCRAGWVGHENQWRGSNKVIGIRQADLVRLYCSKEWEESRQILDQYQIRYVFISNLERQTYQADQSRCPLGLVETKFKRNLKSVFQAGQATIYEYSPTTNTGTPSN